MEELDLDTAFFGELSFAWIVYIFYSIYSTVIVVVCLCLLIAETLNQL